MAIILAEKQGADGIITQSRVKPAYLQISSVKKEFFKLETIKQGPLSGVNVLDFTWVLAGPHATRTLTDMGANVLKVEKFKVGTNERHQALQAEINGVTQCSYHINVNRGKKSLCINLKHPKGIELIHDLIKKSDIIVENFSPGVMGRLKLDYESVKKIRPDIIYCSISAFGHWGYDTRRSGYDIVAQAASGWTAVMTDHEMAPMAIGDTTAAMHACTAILAALYHKTVTGQGQNIDISLVDCLFSIPETSFPAFWLSEAVGIPPIKDTVAQKSPTSAPFGIYNGKNGSIAIAMLTDTHWPELVDLMGPEHAWMKTDPRTRDITGRCIVENAFLTHDALEAWVMSQDSVEEAERKLLLIGAAACRVKSIEELATTDPYIGGREMRLTRVQPFIGPMTMGGSPLKFSETPSTIRGYAPFIGEHNREALSNVLGYSEEQIDELYKEDVLYEAPEVARLPEELKKMTNQ
jgi:crotonobetainyl-CoA:carnitine CoA-transferase CaiB-like acyl-CoA transferase